ncbi:DUF5675 family protein [Pseudodesulfovibrio tunisiensis]|uniref:DUF5675 family protein n=1 Tax=Pseudodesulfovibrio tunisiensis TaxID=463192 RepID=UPI001FB5120A|nr:DUF5675 family protein [Pseudodesulfovibrio tunisiensis]
MIDRAELVRLEKGEDGTFGVLKLNGHVFCMTLEPQDRDNAVGASCIPEGRYFCQPVHSPGFGDVYEIANVPGRTHILVHPGNLVRDTEGCVLLGRRYGTLDGQRGILTSRDTVTEFLSVADNQPFALTIIDASEV